jgi:hypothetical protein
MRQGRLSLTFLIYPPEIIIERIFEPWYKPPHPSSMLSVRRSFALTWGNNLNGDPRRRSQPACHLAPIRPTKGDTHLRRSQ